MVDFSKLLKRNQQPNSSTLAESSESPLPADHQPERKTNMSLELAIKELTEAVKANTAALGGAKSSGSTKSADSPKSEGYKPKHTAEEMSAALTKYKDKTDMDKARAIIKEATGAEMKMKEITDPKHIDAVFDLATAALKKLDDEM